MLCAEFLTSSKIWANSFSLSQNSFFWGISSLLIEGHEIFQSIHSWTGLSIVIISIIQIVPSLTIIDRKKLRNIHKYAGYIS